MDNAPCKFRLDAGQIEVVDDAVAEILRRKAPAQRVAMIFHCGRRVRWAIEGQVRHNHPDWSDEQVKTEVGRRLTHGTA
jgi:hypothetical protein